MMAVCMQCEGKGDGPCLFHLVCTIISRIETEAFGTVEYVPFWNNYELTLPDGRVYNDLSHDEQREAIDGLWGNITRMLDEGRV